MKLRKNFDLTGTGKVFSFTLSQTLKNRGNQISCAILLILVLAAFPIMTLLMGGMGDPMGDPLGNSFPVTALDYEKVYLINETDLPVKATLPFEYGDVPVLETTAERMPALSAEHPEAQALLGQDEDGNLTISIRDSIPDGDSLAEHNRVGLGNAMQTLLEEAQREALGITDAQWATWHTTQASVWVGAMTESDWAAEEGTSLIARFAVEYVYAILVMILCISSSSYIIRAILEERTSKLVELLMVSVRPLALLAGKILAMMVYLFGTILAMFAAGGLSMAITGLFLDTTPVTEQIRNAFSFGNLNLGTILVVLISLFLGYCTFSILAGLAGASCSTMQDMESANLSVSMIGIAAYIASIIVAGVPSGVLHAVASLCPILSVFCAPVAYVCGDISLLVLLLSWVLQALVVVGLAYFSAKIYTDLLTHRGEKVKVRELLRYFRMTKTKREKEVR